MSDKNAVDPRVLAKEIAGEMRAAGVQVISAADLCHGPFHKPPICRDIVPCFRHLCIHCPCVADYPQETNCVHGIYCTDIQCCDMIRNIEDIRERLILEMAAMPEEVIKNLADIIPAVQNVRAMAREAARK